MPDVEMNCGHKAEWSGQQTGDSVWCEKCGNWQSAVRVRTYSLKCRNCRYSRDFGFARLLAEGAIARHLRRFPAHKVYLLEGNRVLLEKSQEKPVQLSFEEPLF